MNEILRFMLSMRSDADRKPLVMADNEENSQDSQKNTPGATNLETKSQPSSLTANQNHVTPVPSGKVTPQKDAYWFAQSGDVRSDPYEPAGRNDDTLDADFRATSPALSLREREERARILRERAVEDRQKRIEELRQTAIQAQRIREQQEEERRRRIDEARVRDVERRQQVEERKKLIFEAEQERKEAILRRNMERDYRVESRRSPHRNSMIFAFGSSTPRYWDTETKANRRAASHSNVAAAAATPSPLGGRFTSHSGDNGHNSGGEDLMTRSLSALPTHARRKTDLTPILPGYRDNGRSPGVNTPRRSGSPNRPNSSMSQQSLSSSHASQSSTVSMRTKSSLTSRKPRPVSIAGSLTDEPPSQPRESRSIERKAPSSKSPRAKSAGADESKPAAGRLTVARKPALPPKPAGLATPNAKPPTPRAKSATSDKLNTPAKDKHKESKATKTTPVPAAPKQKPAETVAAAQPVPEPATTQPVHEKPAAIQPEHDKPAEIQPVHESPPPSNTESLPQNHVHDADNQPEVIQPPPSIFVPETIEAPSTQTPEASSTSQPEVTETNLVDVSEQPSKPRITTEEEAKAALAEKRRLAREQAEREAELERQRQEELRRQEEERLRQEEEDARRWEEEQVAFRKAEEERLRLAIEETEKKEEEERRQREEEAKAKAERDEAEKKAREEAERLRIENEEKLKKEEEERAERKKRVEAIMSRTRGRQGAGSSAKGNGETTDDRGDSAVSTPSDESRHFIDDKEATETNTSPDQSNHAEPFQQPDRAEIISATQEQQNVFQNKDLLAEFISSSGDNTRSEDLLGDNKERLLDSSLTESQIADIRSSDTESVQTSMTDTLAVHTNGYTPNGYDTNENGQLGDFSSDDMYSMESRISPNQGADSVSQKGGASSPGPEETSGAAPDQLLSFNSSSDNPEPSLDKLIDFSTTSPVTKLESSLVNVDNVNSNFTPGQQIINFDDSSLTKKDNVEKDFL